MWHTSLILTRALDVLLPAVQATHISGAAVNCPSGGITSEATLHAPGATDSPAHSSAAAPGPSRVAQPVMTRRRLRNDRPPPAQNPLSVPSLDPNCWPVPDPTANAVHVPVAKQEERRQRAMHLEQNLEAQTGPSGV